VRTYLNTLLHRKRGEYGPLWLFELDDEVWAIVSSGWLEDEEICYAILSEDVQLFNREWGKDGRRPNPTYRTQRMALEEIIRSLRTMMSDLKPDGAEQSKYALYISVAEHDLHQAQIGQIDQLAGEARASELKVHVPRHITSALEVAVATPTIESAQPAAELERTAPAPSAQAEEINPKPWVNPTVKPTGLNFQPDASLHAKMEWVCDNVPKMSKLRILREGAELLCNQLIEKHYRP